MDKLKQILSEAREIWQMVQDLISIQGGLFVDAFAVVMIIRLLAVLRGYPPLTPSEAGMWAATIGAFSYSNTR